MLQFLVFWLVSPPVTFYRHIQLREKQFDESYSAARDRWSSSLNCVCVCGGGLLKRLNLHLARSSLFWVLLSFLKPPSKGAWNHERKSTNFRDKCHWLRTPNQVGNLPIWFGWLWHRHSVPYCTGEESSPEGWGLGTRTQPLQQRRQG